MMCFDGCFTLSNGKPRLCAVNNTLSISAETTHFNHLIATSIKSSTIDNLHDDMIQLSDNIEGVVARSEDNTDNISLLFETITKHKQSVDTVHDELAKTMNVSAGNKDDVGDLTNKVDGLMHLLNDVKNISEEMDEKFVNTSYELSEARKTTLFIQDIFMKMNKSLYEMRRIFVTTTTTSAAAIQYVSAIKTPADTTTVSATTTNTVKNDEATTTEAESPTTNVFTSVLYYSLIIEIYMKLL